MQECGSQSCASDLVANRCPSEVVIRRLAACALELGVRLKLNPDGSLEVLGPFRVSAVAERVESASAIVTANLAPNPERTGAPETPTEIIQASQREPPLRGRRLRQQCLSLTETAYELAISRWTLWRAARSDLPDFPQPVVVSRRVYWKKSDLGRLEDAIMFFEGRCAFDRKRKAAQSAG